MLLCPDHKVPFKTVPAGISKKTGKPKPYPAFQACPEYGCQKRPEDGIEIETFDLPAKHVLDEMPTAKETVMTKVEWNNKDFTEGLRALSYDVRKQDMHPTDAWSSTHLKEWMRAIYGDYDGYNEWEEKMEVRITKLAPKSKDQQMKEDIDEVLEEE